MTARARTARAKPRPATRTRKRALEPATAKGEQSRQKLVDATGALLRKQGYAATGLAQIVDDSGSPRGSLYFYFPGGKEQLACEALDQAGASWRARLDDVTRGKDDGDAAMAACALLADDLVASGFDNGCPIAAVALEETTDTVRKTCAKHFAHWQDTIAGRLTASGTPADQARAMATFVLSAVEGASMLARVRRDPAPLREVGAMLGAVFALTKGARAP